MRPRLAWLAALACLAACSSPRASAIATSKERCARLAATYAPDLAITAATPIEPAPAWTPPPQRGRDAPAVLRAFCRIEGVIAGRIGFEMWLPIASAWNGRLLGAGVGGDAGIYNYVDLARGLEAGFAAITNDSGHKSSEARWMMRKDAVLDYTHRSQHLMNLTARRLINAYYGAPAHHAYFIGCSGGGRQALKEIQEFPEDYDGVLAGAPGPNMPVMSVRHLWQGLYQENNPDGALTDADWDLVAKAVLAKCDANDGIADGVVETPTSCRFDAAELACHPQQGGACLSDAKVATVRTFYAPLQDETGVRLDSGLVPGVRTRPGPPSPLLLPLFAEGAHNNPDWSPQTFHRARDLALVNASMPQMRADNPDLSEYFRRGGKAILYQGWMDPSVVAHQSIDYYRAVQARMGVAATDRSLRLFMAPGMLHCRGGAGADEFGGASAALPIGEARHDMLGALVDWVETGEAPDSIAASRLEGGHIVQERLLCPYPAEARFTRGDPSKAASFTCASPGAPA